MPEMKTVFSGAMPNSGIVFCTAARIA